VAVGVLLIVEAVKAVLVRAGRHLSSAPSASD